MGFIRSCKQIFKQVQGQWNECLECHQDTTSSSLFYIYFILLALSLQLGFLYLAGYAVGSLHASQLISPLFPVSVEKFQGQWFWVGLGQVPTFGPMKYSHEGGVLQQAAILQSMVGVWGSKVPKRKEEVLSIPEEAMLKRQNNETHNGSLVTCMSK